MWVMLQDRHGSGAINEARMVREVRFTLSIGEIQVCTLGEVGWVPCCDESAQEQKQLKHRQSRTVKVSRRGWSPPSLPSFCPPPACHRGHLDLREVSDGLPAGNL